MTSSFDPQTVARLALAVLTTALVACGGGSSPASGGGGSTTLTLSGTAARGAALVSATVEATCASGSGSATSNGTGAYTITVTNGSLPCVLRVPLGDGTFLHSAVGGSGTGTATVNITPLTELIVAQATGVAPETLFAEFASRSAAVTPSALTAAVTAVASTLAVDLSGINPLSTPLVIGDAQDQKIDAVMANLASTGTALADLSTSLVVNSPVNTGGGNTSTSIAPNVALVPADLALKPAADNCVALRSTNYRIVKFAAANAGGEVTNTETMSIDARTLIVTNADNTTDTLMPVGACRYTLTSTPTDAASMTQEIVVSPAGLITFRRKDNDSLFRTGIAFPEQTAPATSTLAGIWNTFGLEAVDPAAATLVYQAVATTSTFGTTGALTAQTRCTGVNTCAALGTAGQAALPAVTVVANATSGYDVSNLLDGSTSRMFAYRAGNGDMMTVAIAAKGSFRIATRQRTNGVANVGNVTRSWDPGVSLSLLSGGPVTESGNTILAATTTSTTRQRFRGNGATFSETLQLNNPRQGYNYRAQGTATASDSTVATLNETVYLPLRGMGATAAFQPGLSNFFVSSGQPDGPWVANDRLFATVAPNCAALRTGAIRTVEAFPGSAGGFSTQTRWVDAPTLQIKTAQAGTLVAQLVPNGGCRYTISGAASLTSNEIVVSPAGVMVVRTPESDSSTRMIVAFPEQSHTLAELAGTWNKLGISAGTLVTDPHFADAATATLDALGNTASPITYCADVLNCVQVTGKTITLAGNVGGGFDRTSSDGWTDRVFAFRAGTGDLMLVNLGSDGLIGVWTPQRVISAPAVGTLNRFWDASLNNAMTSTNTIAVNRNTIVASDATTLTWTRQRVNATGGTFSDQVQGNNPRSGYTHRAAGTTTSSDNKTQTIFETTTMGLKGMGVSAFAQPLGTIFGLSVNQP